MQVQPFSGYLELQLPRTRLHFKWILIGSWESENKIEDNRNEMKWKKSCLFMKNMTIIT